MKFTKSDLNRTAWAHPDSIQAARKWWIIDAAGKPLGRVAVEIAKKLTGKHKGYYCDFWDCGDYVVVVNIDKVVFTGTKLEEKVYYRHSGHKGHLKEIPLKDMLAKHPDRVMNLAVKGMLPKNKMRKPRLKRMKLFVGSAHAYGHLDLQPIDGTNTTQTQQSSAAPQQQQQ